MPPSRVGAMRPISSGGTVRGLLAQRSRTPCMCAVFHAITMLASKLSASVTACIWSARRARCEQAEKVELGAWCESTVPERIGAGFASARLRGREVEERGAHRLLQLQRTFAVQQESQLVRLDAVHRFAKAGRRKRRLQMSQLRLEGGRVVGLREAQWSSVGSTGSLRLGKTKGGSPLRSSRASGLCAW